MKSDFQWQKEENEWDQDQDPVPKNKSARSYFWTYFVGILLIIIVAAYLYLERRTRIAQSPNQLIELTCQTEEAGITANYWYDPSLEKWLDNTKLISDTNASRLTALDENSFLLTEVVEFQDGPHWRVSLWQDDSLSLLVDSATRRQKSIAATDPSHRKLIIAEQDPASGIPRYDLLDLDACQTGECRLMPLPGPIIWSPNGGRTLISHLEGGQFPLSLFLGNAAAISEQQIGAGFARAWIDNEHFVYQPFDQPEPNELQLIISDLDGKTLNTLNTADMPNFFLPSTSSEFSPRSITKVVPHPLIPAEILMALSSVEIQGDTRAGLILRYNWQTDQSEQLLITQGTSPDIQISPDGRWLLIHEKISVDLSGHSKLTLIDLASGQKQNIDESGIIPLNSVWSSDSNWLLSLHPTLLYIINPNENKQQAVPLPNSPCFQAKWVPEN